MKKSFINGMGIALVMSGLLAGCIRDDLSKCSKTAYTSTLYILLAAQTASETSRSERGDKNPVKDAMLYIFDKNDRFVSRQELPAEIIEKRLPFTLEYPTRDSIRVLVWGNRNDARETYLIAPGDPLADRMLKLVPKGEHVNSPSDLFHGMARVSCDEPGENRTRTILLHRKVASASIVCHDKNGTFKEKKEVKFILRHTPDGLNSRGEPTGNPVTYCPDVKADVIDGNPAYTTGLFNLIPCTPEQEMILDIYDKDKIVHSEKLPMKAVANQTMNVIVYFSASTISVHVTLKPWGEIINQHVEWN